MVKYRFYANTLWSLISKENASFPNISPSTKQCKRQKVSVSQIHIKLNQVKQRKFERGILTGTEERIGKVSEKWREQKQAKENLWERRTTKEGIWKVSEIKRKWGTW